MPKVSAEYRDARRAQILQAAAACFAENGFHATSMQDILTRARLSPGAFYRYFPSKADLIAALAHETAGRLEGLIEEVLANSIPGALPVGALVEAVLGFERETGRGQMAIQLWSEAVRDARVRAIVLEVIDRILERLRAVSADEDHARIVYAILQGVTLQSCWDPSLPAAQLARAAESLLNHGR
jgi:AcrR family transcriptional regulator